MSKLGITLAVGIYISAYALLGFGRSPYNMEFLVSQQPDKAKLLVFSADWCQPCKAAKEAMKTDVSLKRIVDSYEVVEYNFDVAMPRKYNVDRVPTFIILADDKEIKRQVGFNSVEKLKDFLD